MAKNCTIGLTQVVDYVTGLLEPAQSEEVRDHVDGGCVSCTERLAMIGTMAADAEPEQSNHLLAQPLLDTQLHPRLTGVRGAATLSRRRVYEAESKICIDIQQHQVASGSVALEGQLLIRGGNLSDVEQAVVALRQDGAVLYESGVDVLGDFNISDIRSGRYDLTVTLESLEVIVKGIEV